MASNVVESACTKFTMESQCKPFVELNSPPPDEGNSEWEIDSFDLIGKITESGIRCDDPRLIPLMQLLDSKHGVDNNIRLNSTMYLNNQNNEKISDCNQLILRILHDDLIVSNFQLLTDTITLVFGETKEKVSSSQGKVADYIPELARVDQNLFAACVCTVDGQRFCIGDSQIEYCLQSSSKPITYLQALTEHGIEFVHQHVGVEPSGNAFNHLSLFQLDSDVETGITDRMVPHNPMINAGAIMSCALIGHKNKNKNKNKKKRKRRKKRDENIQISEVDSLSESIESDSSFDGKTQASIVSRRWNRVREIYCKVCGYEKIGFDNSVYLSEKETANRNWALAYLMNEKKAFPKNTNLRDTLEFYFQTCSITLCCDTMSVLAGTLANLGVCPITNERVFTPMHVEKCLSVMQSCGMYDYSGVWGFQVGLPAKSGVCGAIYAVVPGRMGIAVYAPPLDKRGNSVRGVQFVTQLVQTLKLHSLGADRNQLWHDVNGFHGDSINSINSTSNINSVGRSHSARIPIRLNRAKSHAIASGLLRNRGSSLGSRIDKNSNSRAMAVVKANTDTNTNTNTITNSIERSKNAELNRVVGSFNRSQSMRYVRHRNSTQFYVKQARLQKLQSFSGYNDVRISQTSSVSSPPEIIENNKNANRRSNSNGNSNCNDASPNSLAQRHVTWTDLPTQDDSIDNTPRITLAQLSEKLSDKSDINQETSSIVRLTENSLAAHTANIDESEENEAAADNDDINGNNSVAKSSQSHKSHKSHHSHNGNVKSIQSVQSVTSVKNGTNGETVKCVKCVQSITVVSNAQSRSDGSAAICDECSRSQNESKSSANDEKQETANSDESGTRLRGLINAREAIMQQKRNEYDFEGPKDNDKINDQLNHNHLLRKRNSSIPSMLAMYANKTNRNDTTNNNNHHHGKHHNNHHNNVIDDNINNNKNDSIDNKHNNINHINNDVHSAPDNGTLSPKHKHAANITGAVMHNDGYRHYSQQKQQFKSLHPQTNKTSPGRQSRRNMATHSNRRSKSKPTSPVDMTSDRSGLSFSSFRVRTPHSQATPSKKYQSAYQNVQTPGPQQLEHHQQQYQQHQYQQQIVQQSNFETIGISTRISEVIQLYSDNKQKLVQNVILIGIIFVAFFLSLVGLPVLICYQYNLFLFSKRKSNGVKKIDFDGEIFNLLFVSFLAMVFLSSLLKIKLYFATKENNKIEFNVNHGKLLMSSIWQSVLLVVFWYCFVKSVLIYSNSSAMIGCMLSCLLILRLFIAWITNEIVKLRSDDWLFCSVIIILSYLCFDTKSTTTTTTTTSTASLKKGKHNGASFVNGYLVLCVISLSLFQSLIQYTIKKQNDRLKTKSLHNNDSSNSGDVNNENNDNIENNNTHTNSSDISEIRKQFFANLCFAISVNGLIMVTAMGLYCNSRINVNVFSNLFTLSFYFINNKWYCIVESLLLISLSVIFIVTDFTSMRSNLWNVMFTSMPITYIINSVVNGNDGDLNSKALLLVVTLAMVSLLFKKALTA